MNVISYIKGDTHITDFPDCSARALAAFVQVCNDLLAGPDDYLSPENSLLAVELGSQTVGTADVDDTVIHAWVAELLASPTWGVVRYAKRAARYAKSGADKAVLDIAELHRAVAAGDTPPIAAWNAADRAARAACRASKPTVHVAGLYALRAAYRSTALVNTDRQVTLDAVTGNASHAHTLATGAPRQLQSWNSRAMRSAHGVVLAAWTLVDARTAVSTDRPNWWRRLSSSSDGGGATTRCGASQDL